MKVSGDHESPRQISRGANLKTESKVFQMTEMPDICHGLFVLSIVLPVRALRIWVLWPDCLDKLTRRSQHVSEVCPSRSQFCPHVPSRLSLHNLCLGNLLSQLQRSPRRNQETRVLDVCVPTNVLRVTVTRYPNNSSICFR